MERRTIKLTQDEYIKFEQIVQERQLRSPKWRVQQHQPHGGEFHGYAGRFAFWLVGEIIVCVLGWAAGQVYESSLPAARWAGKQVTQLMEREAPPHDPHDRLPTYAMASASTANTNTNTTSWTTQPYV